MSSSGAQAYMDLKSHGCRVQWASGWAAERTVRALAMLSVVFVASPVAAAISSIWRSSFDRSTISRAVDESMKSIGIGMIVLAAVV